MAERLTRREVQVLGLLSEGLSYRAVSEQLHITEPTVQTLAHRAYQKLGVSGRAAAAKEAKRLGVL
jgi:ATP/maltotriose-dependent transcriptional regulator MalT